MPDCWELREEKRKSLGVPPKTGSVRSGIKEAMEEVWVRKVRGSVIIELQVEWQVDTVPENSVGH